MSDWYYAADNEQKGPINESELKADLATNKIPADTLVWKEGMEAWTPANQVPAFSFRPPPMPAKVQPTAATPAAASVVSAVQAAIEKPAPVTTKAHASVNNPDSTKPVDFKSMVGKPESLEVDAEDAETNKVSGILGYLFILFIVPLLNAKESPFCRYHGNQGLVLFLSIIATSIVLEALAYLPFVGFIFAWLFIPYYLIILGMIILGILNAANGKCVPLPFIGGVKLVKGPASEEEKPQA